jgi:PKD repeat protein
MNNVKNIKKNKAVNYIVMVVVAILLISISFTPVLSNPNESVGSSLFVKFIVGTSALCSGGPPTTGSLVTVTSSEGTRTSTTFSDGSFQVDISGVPPNPDWPDGTTFTLTITDGSWTGSTSGSVSGSVTDVGLVTLYPPALNAAADGSPTTIVAGETVSFTGSATGGATPYSWSWDFGGDGTSTLQNPSHTFNTQGTYVCVLTVTDACSSTDTDSVTITVNPTLSCDANGPYSGTICNAVQFTGTAIGGHPGYTWDWDFGDGSPHSSEQNPTHLYASDGSYTATLTVTDSQLDTAVDTASVSISTSSVAAEAGGPYSGTICDPISFTGGAAGGCPPYTFSWDFGDGGSSTLQNPTYQYSSDGSYTATFTVTDDKGGSDTDTASVTVSTPGLVASADGPDNGCTGESVSFTGGATGGCTPYSYSWGFGDGGTSTQQNPSHTYSSPGVYTVTLTVTDDASNTDADSFTITIADCLLDVDAHGPYYGEVGESIQFTGSVSGGTAPYYYQWDFGDGSISDEQNPTHI